MNLFYIFCGIPNRRTEAQQFVPSQVLNDLTTTKTTLAFWIGSPSSNGYTMIKPKTVCGVSLQPSLLYWKVWYHAR